MISICNGLRNESLHFILCDLFEEASSVYITLSRLHERVNLRQSTISFFFFYARHCRLVANLIADVRTILLHAV